MNPWSRKLLSAALTSLLTVVGAQAEILQIEFTAEEGYANGSNLGPGSSSWYGQGGGYNTVDATGTGSVTLDPDTADTRCIYNAATFAPSSSPMTVSLDFDFTEAVVSGSGEVMTLLISKNNAVAIDVFASLQRDGANNYRFSYSITGGSSGTSPVFSDTALGFDGTLEGASDTLSLSASLYKGSDASDWTLLMKLHNLAQSTDVSSFVQSNIVTSTTFFNDTTLRGGFSSAAIEAATGTGNRVVERFGVGLGEADPGGGNSGSTLTGGEMFVTNYNLSGSMTADFDLDGQLDVVEFAHGGNPTNPADLATLPAVMVGTNGMAGFISYETTNSNPGIPYIAEWTDNLASGRWSTVWDVQTNLPSSLPGYTQIERRILDEYRQLYYRTRLSHKAGRPNILLIVADDLGYADVSFNNTHPAGPDLYTPELDSLATNGTIFTSAYVVHPFCGPSRMGLMSGRYPHEFGAPYNLPDSDTGYWTDQGIPASETLFSSVLQDAGYFTGIMGKWHLGQQPVHHPNARGFDEFWGFLGGGKYYDPAELKPQGPSGAIVDYHTWPEHNGEEVEPTDWMTDWLTQKGTNFIHTAATNSEPFFLFMSYNAPHTPLDYKPSDYQALTTLLQNTVVEQRKKYLALVYALDRGVGDLVDALKATGQYDNTLIVFISDNGGRQNYGSSNHPLRGWKDDVLEGGVRVPMFMHWPGVVASNTIYDHPITALDFYPTFARLADAIIPTDKDLDGKDIWNAVLSGTNPRPGESVYTVRYQAGYSTTGFTHVGIRRDNWKAVRWYTHWKLFNFDLPGHKTEADIYDLSAAYPEVLSNMVSEAASWAGDHVRPLWFDSPLQETLWDDRNLPQYDQAFSLP